MRRRTFARRLLTAIAAIPAASATRHASAAPAAPIASLSCATPVVAPLQPIQLDIVIPGYTGPASVVLYDSQKRYAGTADGQIAGGSGSIAHQPRGALGPQWAALFASGQQIASNGALFTLEAQTAVATGQPYIDGFVPAARALMGQAVVEYTVDKARYRGYRSSDSPLLWLRDHVYAARGGRYIDADLRVLLDRVRDLQFADGSMPDFPPRPPYVFAAYRTPVEADVEFVYVTGVCEVWQATGDDAWVKTHLGAMRKAIGYTVQHPLRWDAARGLVRRPYTIDMWDFEYGPTTTDPNSGHPAPRHWIDDKTIWGAFHGDNTGTAQALRSLAIVEDRMGDAALAKVWRDVADGIVRNLNALAWNGRFYRHQVPFSGFRPAGVDEASQLSLSNAYALNRGVLSDAQSQAIVDEYIRRAAKPNAFAEWYSIDPPFPQGSFGLNGRSGEAPGSYVNGGIMPLVGGELARGAFRSGNESYGYAILDHYWRRMLSKGRSFLWYHRDGAEGVGSEATTQYDAWGCGAMLAALVEGAAGIEDRGIGMRDVTLSLRWPEAGIASAYAVARYPAGDGYLAYAWSIEKGGINLQVSSVAYHLRIRLLLPPTVKGEVTCSVNNAPVKPTYEKVRGSRYTVIETGDSLVNVQIRF